MNNYKDGYINGDCVISKEVNIKNDNIQSIIVEKDNKNIKIVR